MLLNININGNSNSVIDVELKGYAKFNYTGTENLSDINSIKLSPNEYNYYNSNLSSFVSSSAVNNLKELIMV